MFEDLNELLNAFDDLKIFAFGFLCALLIIGSVWIELAWRAL